MMQKSYIVIHHSAVEDGKALDWPGIRDYHKNIRQWDNIGYHYGVDYVKGFPEVLIGRWEYEMGAHCPEMLMNRIGIGVCCLGNYSLIDVPGNKWNRLKELCIWLMKRNKINPDGVIGHREAQAMAGRANTTECPGLKFDLKKLRKELQESLLSS